MFVFLESPRGKQFYKQIIIMQFAIVIMKACTKCYGSSGRGKLTLPGKLKKVTQRCQVLRSRFLGDKNYGNSYNNSRVKELTARKYRPYLENTMTIFR